ncbi:competence protein ComEC family protein [Candidatus Nomurabacteria bacterium]|nr:competence protein ComEC family protein [Candidatus Nomurabacteria bacterium]
MRDRVFYAICFGFAIGVFIRSFLSLNLYLIILLGIISFFLILFFVLVSRDNLGIIFSVFVLLFSLGVLRFHMADKSAPVVFESQVNKKVMFSGIIIDDPDKRENNQKLTVEIKEGEEKTKVLVTVSLDEVLKYGDEISFTGVLEKPENFITDQGKNFDYINYLRKDGIHYLMNYADIEVLSQNNGNLIKNALFFIKNKFLEKMNLAIHPPESLLMSGLILGEKSAFSEELRQSFIDTGTIHIVALSGFNITIVAEWVMKFFTFLPLNFGISMGILAISLFVLMTGAGSTGLRAGLMATLALIARATGRNYDVGRALILAGVAMISLNPFVLVFDVSFQLSFIATVAVIFFAPRVEKYFLWVPKTFGLRDIIAVTSAAYIFVLPFVVYKMGNLSLVALPANILILPLIPLTMFLGFLTSFFGVIWYGLSVPFGMISYWLLHYELFVVDFFSKLPFASFAIPDFPLMLTILIYAYFIYMLFGRSVKSWFLN